MFVKLKLRLHFRGFLVFFDEKIQKIRAPPCLGSLSIVFLHLTVSLCAQFKVTVGFMKLYLCLFTGLQNNS